MRTAALTALTAALLSGCAGGDARLTPAASASASCSAVADLFERPGLRLADVARLGRAQEAAQAAAADEPRWAALAASITRMRAAAARVAESAQQPTSGPAQRALNAEYTAAEGEAAQACSRV